MNVSDIMAEVQRQGWRVVRDGGGHYKFYSPCGKHIVVVAVSPSDHRAVKNIRARFRRAGAKL